MSFSALSALMATFERRRSKSATVREELPPSTPTISAKSLHDHLSDALGRVQYGEERIVVTKSGKPCAALVPLRLLAVLERAEDLLDAHDATEARADVEARGSVSLLDVKARLGL